MKIQEAEIVDSTLKEEIFTRLDVIAEKLGVAAEHLWEIFTQQAIITGTTTLCVFSVVCLIGIWLVRHATLKNHKPYFSTGDEPTGTFFVLIGGIVTLLVSGIGLLSKFQESLGQILNPEYYAWLEIKRLIQ